MPRMSTDARHSGVEQLRQLAAQGLDVASFWRECNEVLARVVPHHLAPCWFTVDPASLLVTSHFDPVIPEISHDFLAHEYGEEDELKMVDVARSASGISSIHELTGGDPGRSEGWRNFVQPYGGDQQLLVALRARSGVTWGVLALYRADGAPEFSVAERAFLVQASRHLAEGAIKGLLLGEAQDPEGPEAPAVVVLDEDWQVQSMTPEAEAVMAELQGSGQGGPGLPTTVLSVAGRALGNLQSRDAPGEVAVARVRSDRGRWITIHGAPLVHDGTRRVAVIIERADPDRLAPLLMDAYGLSVREKDVTRLVLNGCSTKEIATRLYVSAQTVQQHMKQIFEKTGVHSRRELVSKIFFSHYEPRFRDNERRTVEDRPIRGGPLRTG